MKTTIDELWTEYAAKAIPEVEETSIQYTETRKAFYAGAFGLFADILTIMDKGSDTAIERFMKGYELQLMEYRTELIVTCRKG